MTAPAAPGWYADPWNPAGFRWWDGTNWTPHVSAAAAVAPTQPPLVDEPGLKWLLPVGRSPWAIAAGYAGIGAILGCLAPVAILLGIVAIWDVKRTGKMGMGRAVFGIVAGVVAMLVYAALIFGSGA